MSHLIAYGAVSPLGHGRQAFAVAEVGERARFSFAPVAAFANAGVRRSAAAQLVPPPGARPRGEDHRLLDQALDDCVSQLDAARPGWRSSRVGLVLGTSAGGMDAAELLFQALLDGSEPAPEVLVACSYGSGFARAEARLGSPLVRRASVLVACASSTVALGLAHLWLEQDQCDVVLAGGYDALSLFVTAGFSALGAVTGSRPRPFRTERDGLALGEGAGVVALVRMNGAASSLCRIGGFGLSSDAVHVTAPDRAGQGLTRAALAALRSAGRVPFEVGLVGAHATATPFNDAAEAAALAVVAAPDAVVHAQKASSGHALGAAGVLEVLATADAIDRAILPATASEGTLDPAASVCLLDRSASGRSPVALKLSAAFGGANAALVVLASSERTADVRIVPGALCVGETVSVDLIPDLALLEALTGATAERLGKLDGFARLVVAAVAELARKEGLASLTEVGLVVQTSYATLATNERFFARIAEKGAAFAEPRRFPPTSPNLAAGEASILLGIRGPVLTLGGSPLLGDQATAVARDLLVAGLCESVLVVEADEPSAPATQVAGYHGLAPPTGRATARHVRLSTSVAR